MQEEMNTKVVQAGYAAFGSRDIPALLDLLDDSVVWQGVVGSAPEVPTSGVRTGKQAVADFFRAVDENQNFNSFEPQQFVAQGDTVVVLGHYNVTHKTTGGNVDTDWVMIFKLANGKIVSFKEFADSAAVNAAWKVPSA
jgi:ketosteroid isomerase-like protein